MRSEKNDQQTNYHLPVEKDQILQLFTFLPKNDKISSVDRIIMNI